MRGWFGPATPRSAAVSMAVMALVGCQSASEPDVPPLLPLLNTCLVEAGLEPVLEPKTTDRIMTAAQASVYGACMDRAIPQRRGAATCSSTAGEEIVCDG